MVHIGVWIWILIHTLPGPVLAIFAMESHFCNRKPFFSTENGVIKLLPNQKRERQKERLDGQGPRKQVRQTMHSVTSIILMCMCALMHCSVEHFEPKGR